MFQNHQSLYVSRGISAGFNSYSLNSPYHRLPETPEEALGLLRSLMAEVRSVDHCSHYLQLTLSAPPQSAEPKGEGLSFESSAFETLERDFQQVGTQSFSMKRYCQMRLPSASARYMDMACVPRRCSRSS